MCVSLADRPVGEARAVVGQAYQQVAASPRPSCIVDVAKGVADTHPCAYH